MDVTELMIGPSKRASDVALAGSMKLVSAAETVIAHVVALRAEEVAAQPAAEAAPARRSRRPPRAEPEVIKKGKKEEEAPEPKEKGQEEVSRHVPGGRSGESGRGVRAHAA